jgi:hypothetical protein
MWGTDLLKILFQDTKLHFTVFIISVVSLVFGTITLNIGDIFSLIILPLIPALFIAVLFYVYKPITWIDDKQSKISSKLILLLICPVIVKLASSSGSNIELLLNVGPALVLKELGSLGTIIFGLPVALYLGFDRESIGMTSSICREPQLAVLTQRYGFDSVEVKGFFIVYLIGIVLGTILISLLTNLLSFLIPLHPYSYALATGMGSTSMNVAALSSLTAMFPDMSNQLEAFSGISNLISIAFSVYVYMFISLPLTEKLYSLLKPILK